MSGGRCSELSEAAGESISATAVTADRWLVLEVPGPWPRDVSQEGPLTPRAHAAVARWVAETPRSRVQFVRHRSPSSDGLRAFVVIAEEGRGGVRALTVEHHDELASLDLDTAGDLLDAPLVLVCGHGSRDQCCALRGTSVLAVLAAELGDDTLWISSHQGGHRFAANVLVLPAGVQLGRVEPARAAESVRAALAGHVDLDRYRGRTCYEPEVQAGEHAIRRAGHIDRLADLRLEDVADGVVAFRGASGTLWRALVAETTGPAVPASCGAEAEPQRSFTARVL